MENTARLFNCARCCSQTVICSDCDRGNIYCGKQCAEIARKASLRAAGRRYQRTRRGRFKHAERQRRYRAKSKKVTHQGSQEPVANDPLPPRSETQQPVVVIEDEGIRCDFCARLCSAFLRLDFLHTTVSSSASDRKIINRPLPLRS